MNERASVDPVTYRKREPKRYSETEYQFKSDIINPEFKAALYKIIVTDPETGKKMLVDAPFPVPEIFTKDLTTGNLNEFELLMVREYMELYELTMPLHKDFLFEWFGEGEAIQMKKLPLEELIVFLAGKVHSYTTTSKSREMAGVKEALTQRAVIDSQELQRHRLEQQEKPKFGWFKGGGNKKPINTRDLL